MNYKSPRETEGFLVYELWVIIEDMKSKTNKLFQNIRDYISVLWMTKLVARVTFFLFTFLFLVPSSAQAQTVAWSGRCLGPAEYAQDVATIQGVECLVANVLATAITIIGIAAFVMFLIGSFRYLTAGANSKGVEGGKNAISFAILGIVVALASFLILRFISTFTGVTTILQFNTQLP